MDYGKEVINIVDKIESVEYYKKEIIRMTNEIKNLKCIEMIYGFMKELYDTQWIKFIKLKTTRWNIKHMISCGYFFISNFIL